MLILAVVAGFILGVAAVSAYIFKKLWDLFKF